MRLKSAGFTLLEILVALFIFTFVAIIMTHGLRIVANAESTTEAHAERLSALQTTLLIFSRDVEQTIDRPVKNAGEQQEPSFVGKRITVSLTHGGYANPLGKLNRSTLQRTTYHLANHQLVRSSWQTLDQASQGPEDSRTLLSDVDDLQFSYVDGKGKRYRTWPDADPTNTPGLPRAVEIKLTLTHWGTITQLYLIDAQGLTPHEK